MQRIQTCIADVTLIAAALAGAKRRPPAVVPDALGRLLATLGELALQAEAEAEPRKPVLSPSVCRPEPPFPPKPNPEAEEKAAILAKLARVEAEIAERSKPKAAPRAAPVATAAPRAGKPREPRLPTIPEVVLMLERVVRLKEGAVIGTGKNQKPADVTDLAKLWLTDERRLRASLRKQYRWADLAERTPERICSPDMSQRPEAIGEPWEHEEEWLDGDSAVTVSHYDGIPCSRCGRGKGEKHTNRCQKGLKDSKK